MKAWLAPQSSLLVQVIARVQGLTMLNGSAVRERERRDCELRYLRAVLGEAFLPTSTSSQHDLAMSFCSDVELLPVWCGPNTVGIIPVYCCDARQLMTYDSRSCRLTAPALPVTLLCHTSYASASQVS